MSEMIYARTKAHAQGFFGPLRFLSNFYPAPMILEGIHYPTSEHAYQALKFTDPETRKIIASQATPGKAKRKSHDFDLRPDWEEIKLDVMEYLLEIKFRDPTLRALLLETGDTELHEVNWWHDNFWGWCVCKGCGNIYQNKLGSLLMNLRAQLKEHSDVGNTSH
jgi:ribA/ribD-fused uncharacterized protein